MTSNVAHDLGFAAEHDTPIPYLQRIRDYYQALGYGAPYEWAHYAEVPFHRLPRPLSACRVALVTTAAPYQPGLGEQGPGAPYNASAKFYTVYSGDTAPDPDLRISHVAIDRQHTTAEDPGTLFPAADAAQRRRRGPHRLRRLALPRRADQPQPARDARGRRPGDRRPLPGRRGRCSDPGAELPGLPPDHQPRRAPARENGIATVVMGCAKDIVERVGVPRFLFSDFPLGNAAGRPNDPASQATTLELALALLETAPAPRTTVQSPLRWSASADWKLDYCNIERLTPDEIARRRAAFDAGKAQAKALREQQEPSTPPAPRR